MRGIAIVGERVLHIVAAEPLPFVGKARIGLYQIRHVRRRINRKQAVIWQRGVRADNANGTVGRRHFKLLTRRWRNRLAGRHGLLRRARDAPRVTQRDVRSLDDPRGDIGITALNAYVADQLSRFQRDALDCRWRRVCRTPTALFIVTFVTNPVVMGDIARVGGVTLAGDIVVAH